MNAPHPYAAVARKLVDNGWSPIPLPPGKKAAPPGGRTGRGALAVTGDDADDFIARGMPVGARRFPIGNVALALPGDVIGIDVDTYDGKRGAETMRALTAQLGRLPRTVVSSRRFDTHPASGIRFFRVPPGTELVGNLTSEDGDRDVEIIQRHHRYAVTAPSVVDGAAYVIRDQRTDAVLEVMPPAAELPDLPAAWLEHLRVPLQRKATAPGAAPVDLSGGGQSHQVQQRKAEVIAEIATGSRHDAVTKGVMGLVRLGERGETGVKAAIEEVRGAFVRAVCGDGTRTPAQAHGEFDRMLPGAQQKVAETPTPKVGWEPVGGTTWNPLAPAPSPAPSVASTTVDTPTTATSAGTSTPGSSDPSLSPGSTSSPSAPSSDPAFRERLAALAATAPAPVLSRPELPLAPVAAAATSSTTLPVAESGAAARGTPPTTPASAIFDSPNPIPEATWTSTTTPAPTVETASTEPATETDGTRSPDSTSPAPATVTAPAEYVPSWRPVDVEQLLDDDYQGPKAELWPIDDGMFLLYRGAVHQLFGQPETWKSWLSLWAIACTLRAGGRCLLVDAEDRAVAAVARLRKLGVSKADIRRGLDTVEPSANPHSEAEHEAFTHLVANAYDLVVIDSVTRTGALSGIKSNDQDSMTFWFGAVPSAFARRGAAVIVVDHVPKPSKDAADGAERYAGGSNAKLGIVQVSYRVAVTDKPAPRMGHRGGVQLSCTKDRHGDVKQHAERFDVAVDSTGDTIGVKITAVMAEEPPTPDERTVAVKQAVMRALANGGLGAVALRKETRLYHRGKIGNDVFIDEAAKALVQDGIVTRTQKSPGAAVVTALTESWVARCKEAGIPVPDQEPAEVAWDPATALLEPADA